MHKTLKRYIIILVPYLLALLASCEERVVKYDGPDFVMFCDSVLTLPVVDDDSVFQVKVCAMHATDYDRTLAVELKAGKSNAVRGYHFELLGQTITIPAGQMVGSVKVKGYHSRLEAGDSLGFILELLPGDMATSPLYGTQARILLEKAKRFDLQDFVGYAVVQSTWIYSYMTIEERLIRIEADATRANRIVLRDFYYNGFDVKLDLTSKDISNPLIHFEEQVFAPTTEAFGTIYGDGKIWMSENSIYPSYYSSLEGFLFLYTDLEVKNVGRVGTFVHLIKMVSDEEAEHLIKEGIDHAPFTSNQ